MFFLWPSGISSGQYISLDNKLPLYNLLLSIFLFIIANNGIVAMEMNCLNLV